MKSSPVFVVVTRLSLKRWHRYVIQGVMEMQGNYKTDIVTNNQVQYFLDRFYMMRISIRMLLSQHLLMFGSELNKHRRYVGSIDPDCNVREILDDAHEDAKFLCEHYYSAAPEMEVRVHSVKVTKTTEDVSQVWNRAAYHVVKYYVSLPKHISDLGGGIPRSQMDLVFNYTYTTARQAERCGEPSLSSMELGPPDQGTNAPMAGYGYGLPLSRLYAKYFNGDLILSSVEGYGTDAIVYLKRNAAEADELLPVFNRTSAKQYGSASIPVADWSNPHITTGWRRN
ncbi:putative pyruvate dehydrogenase [Schistosoma mansoni]|uniref:putative pyruvate dehydrogenase n=1 Tax=Schistosoma mansoni TaxID=6183 RepID=UPI0001A62E05|nr:putative pyruvate dehydrogenase [Schistosoma mansoni]|eukprot:XP_018648258.1 putative pyruvate dehydrogenase [Schistosoma mansoni]